MGTASGRTAPAATPVTLEEIAARAAQVRPLLAERARQTEADRRVSADVLKALDDAGLLALTKPARFGGQELGPGALIRLGFELGQACGSTAWCANLVNCNAWFLSYWSLSAQQDVWQQRPQNLVAAPLAPTGKCAVVDGGYQLSGQWPFASNCENSAWTVVSAIVPESDGKPSGAAWFLTPMDTVTIDQNSWHMAGLQGTGSKTLVAEEPIFVPAHRMVRVSDVVAGTTPGAEVADNPLNRFGWSTFGGVALVSPLLGMAQGALNWYADNMRTRMRPGAPNNAAENPFVQERAGYAAATIDAALRLLIADVADAEQAIAENGALDDAQRIRVRRSIGFAARSAVEAVSTVYGGAGASAAELSRPIQRFWRDVNAGAGHVSLDVKPIMALAGANLFGLKPAGAF